MQQTDQKSDRVDEVRDEGRRKESTTSGMLEAKFAILATQLNTSTDPSMRLALLEKMRHIQQRLDGRKPSDKAHA